MHCTCRLKEYTCTLYKNATKKFVTFFERAINEIRGLILSNLFVSVQPVEGL